jgi:Na+/H+-dicarboxylate symporter
MIGNAVATLVVARWEKELDQGALKHHLRGEMEMERRAG